MTGKNGNKGASTFPNSKAVPSSPVHSQYHMLNESSYDLKHLYSKLFTTEITSQPPPGMTEKPVARAQLR